LKWFTGVLLVVLVALGVAISVIVHRAEPMLRGLIVQELQEHFHARVELAGFHISLVNGFWAQGKGLKIWPPSEVVGVTVPGEDNTMPPLISLAQFRFHAPLHYKRGQPIRISMIQLQGLDITIPPKTHMTHAEKSSRPSSSAKTASAFLRFVINRIECKDARLTLEPSKPGKLPLDFDISHITLTDISESGTMRFDALLTNPRPAGTILTSGSLGPWVVEDPGETPIAGNYRFDHADLSVFKDIAGILDSTGKYTGVLRNMEVDGQTNTPDFRLKSFGTAMSLKTRFHAHVDGTNGDTWLQPVDATLGQSHFTASGKIVRQQAIALKNGRTVPPGHDIALNVNVDRGKIEDFLRLASHTGSPMLSGDLNLKTSFHVPPGTDPVLQRMQLNGEFFLNGATFTSTKIQGSIEQLSLRGQGKPKEAKQAKDASSDGEDVRSAMQGDFKMANGILSLPDLRYAVPGAEIDLKGTYGLDGGALDFAGAARTDATISKMVGGWKGALLKLADPLFKKDGAGALIPIHVLGTRDDPKFGVDLGRKKHTSPQVPGEPQ
jgi:hypothetical protein